MTLSPERPVRPALDTEAQDWEDLGYRNLTSVSVGFRHACGRRDDDEVVCWGDEFFGETDPP